MTPPGDDARAARDRLLAIDRVCDVFEREWRARRRPAIEALLLRAPERLRADLAVELILLEVEFRRTAGERPTVAEYRRRFPFVEARALAGIDERDAITLPTILGEYELTGRLGGGGMGVVYLARHRRMTRLVAVKVLSAGAPDQDEARQRFDRETRITALLSHPNVVTAFDAREDEGVRYLVTEYMPGGDLGRLVRKSGPLPVAAAVAAARQAALGLAHAHGQGVIHRDVKPGNLLRDAAGVVRVADWGLARIQADLAAARADETLTDLGSLIGTVDFLSPEQARRPDLVTPATDVYGLGCTLFFLLTGRPPFVGGGHLDRLAAHRSTVPPDVRTIRPDVPTALAECLARMLAKQPGDRHRDMPAVVADLDQAADPSRTDWTAFTGDPAPDRRVSRRRAVLAAVAMTGVTGGVGWLIARNRDRAVVEPPPPPVSTRESPIADMAGYQRAWARRCGVEVEMTDERGIRLVFVPPGTFRMGSAAAVIARFTDPRVEPAAQRREWVAAEGQRVVTIRRPFYLSRTEITRAEFAAYADDTNVPTLCEQFDGGWGYDVGRAQWRHGNFSWRNMGDFVPQPDHPVGNITWEDARKFCQWLTATAPPGVRYRLPAESEWEFAARAGGVGLWSHGDDPTELDKYAVFGGLPLPRPVAGRRPNALGLFDLAGNLPEWCDPADPWTDSRCPRFSRPARGGGFYSSAGHIRPAAFQWLDPKSPDPGVRVLREIPESAGT